MSCPVSVGNPGPEQPFTPRDAALRMFGVSMFATLGYFFSVPGDNPGDEFQKQEDTVSDFSLFFGSV